MTEERLSKLEGRSVEIIKPAKQKKIFKIPKFLTFMSQESQKKKKMQD